MDLRIFVGRIKPWCFVVFLDQRSRVQHPNTDPNTQHFRGLSKAHERFGIKLLGGSKSAGI